jgi:hypothetical protein
MHNQAAFFRKGAVRGGGSKARKDTTAHGLSTPGSKAHRNFCYLARNPFRFSRSKQVSATRAISRKRFAVPRAQHSRTGSEAATSDLGLNRAARCPAAEKKFSVNFAVSIQVPTASPSSARMRSPRTCRGADFLVLATNEIIRYGHQWLARCAVAGIRASPVL